MKTTLGGGFVYGGPGWAGHPTGTSEVADVVTDREDRVFIFGRGLFHGRPRSRGQPAGVLGRGLFSGPTGPRWVPIPTAPTTATTVRKCTPEGGVRPPACRGTPAPYQSASPSTAPEVAFDPSGGLYIADGYGNPACTSSPLQASTSFPGARTGAIPASSPGALGLHRPRGPRVRATGRTTASGLIPRAPTSPSGTTCTACGLHRQEDGEERPHRPAAALAAGEP